MALYQAGVVWQKVVKNYIQGCVMTNRFYMAKVITMGEISAL
jgi:hypothetical protein